MRILAVDHGEARTGTAVCDEKELLASPLRTLRSYNFGKLVDELVALTDECGAKLVVVGLPKNMDGTEGSRARDCRELAAALAERTGLPVETYDERLTTVAAHRLMDEGGVYGKKRKANTDNLSAALILEDYLKRRHSRIG